MFGLLQLQSDQNDETASQEEVRKLSAELEAVKKRKAQLIVRFSRSVILLPLTHLPWERSQMEKAELQTAKTEADRHSAVLEQQLEQAQLQASTHMVQYSPSVCFLCVC